MLQWKPRLIASFLTLALLAAAFVGGVERFLRYLDW